MKKLLLLLVIIIASTTIASAQFVKFGIKGGLNVNSSDFQLKKGHLDDQALNAVKNKAGYHVGIMTRINLAAIYVQGDLLYTHNAYKYEIDGGHMNVKENRLSVPVVAGLNILFLRIYAGPKFDFYLSNKLDKSVANGTPIQNNFDNRWLGYQAGVGIDFLKRISLDFSYNGYFKAPTQQYIIGGNDFQIKQKSRQYWVSVGYYFGSGNKKYKMNKE